MASSAQYSAQYPDFRTHILATLKFEINLLPADFGMEEEEPKVKGLLEIRYGWIIFIFRLAGIPFKMKKLSTLYVIYMITVIICIYSTYVCMLLDVYIHRDDMGHVMTNLRIFFSMTSVVWIYFSCR